MMWKIAGIATSPSSTTLHPAACRREQMHIVIRLSIISFPGSSEPLRNGTPKHVKGALRNACCHLAAEHSLPS
jgi:hypothetical protein